MPRATTATLPGGMPAARFLTRYWQRRALLVRAAMPGFTGPLQRRDLVRLAARDDVESRLVVRTGSSFALHHGPFRAGDFRALPARDWTLLVQGVNLHDRAADTLLRRFAFVPYARLDDVMVSYAAPGGGVGPHVDSYDVFLLQGAGRRRWRWGAQQDQALRPDLPVKILRRFHPTADAVLEPGDMLYVPPGHAHDGVAVDACTTWSIGFRAPAHQELVESFLDRLRDTLVVPGRHVDRALSPTRHPARLDRGLLASLAAPLARIRWTARDVERFLGSFLSEPKSHVVFEPPRPALTAARFRAACTTRGVALDLRTQLLYDTRALYLNGHDIAMPRDGAAVLRRLADARALDAAACRALPPRTLGLLHDWYRHGYVHPRAP
jgi:50S ribosomal protein L16 3-hydroxylase